MIEICDLLQTTETILDLFPFGISKPQLGIIILLILKEITLLGSHHSFHRSSLQLAIQRVSLLDRLLIIIWRTMESFFSLDPTCRKESYVLLSQFGFCVPYSQKSEKRVRKAMHTKEARCELHNTSFSFLCLKHKRGLYQYVFLRKLIASSSSLLLGT